MARQFNVRYFDESGHERLYLGVNISSKRVAERWRDAFNERYRKPYPNGQGYYASAQVVEI